MSDAGFLQDPSILALYQQRNWDLSRAEASLQAGLGVMLKHRLLVDSQQSRWASLSQSVAATWHGSVNGVERDLPRQGFWKSLCFHRERERQQGPGILLPAEFDTTGTPARRLSNEQRSWPLYPGSLFPASHLVLPENAAFCPGSEPFSVLMK